MQSCVQLCDKSPGGCILCGNLLTCAEPPHAVWICIPMQRQRIISPRSCVRLTLTAGQVQVLDKVWTEIYEPKNLYNHILSVFNRKLIHYSSSTLFVVFFFLLCFILPSLFRTEHTTACLSFYPRMASNMTEQIAIFNEDGSGQGQCNEIRNVGQSIQPRQWFAGRTRLDMDDTTWHDRFVRFLHSQPHFHGQKNASLVLCYCCMLSLGNHCPKNMLLLQCVSDASFFIGFSFSGWVCSKKNLSLQLYLALRHWNWIISNCSVILCEFWTHLLCGKVSFPLTLWATTLLSLCEFLFLFCTSGCNMTT